MRSCQRLRKDKPSTDSPINSENLNKIEQGIVLAVSRSTEAKTNADAVKGAFDRGELTLLFEYSN